VREKTNRLDYMWLLLWGTQRAGMRIAGRWVADISVPTDRFIILYPIL